jgi:hypothetical protein
VGSNLTTDMSAGDFFALNSLLADTPNNQIEHISLDDSNFLYECGYPKNCGAAWLFTHDQSFYQLRHFVANILPSAGVESAKALIRVEDGSGQNQGADQRWASLLSMLGLNAVAGGKTVEVSQTTIRPSSDPLEAVTANWLGQYFGVASGGSSAHTFQSNPAYLTLILGSQEEKAFLGNPGVGQ